MADRSMKDKFKGIVRSLLTPKVPTAEAYMETRKKKLDSMGGKKSGGMFDFIYKKRKERDQALQGIDY